RTAALSHARQAFCVISAANGFSRKASMLSTIRCVSAASARERSMLKASPRGHSKLLKTACLRIGFSTALPRASFALRPLGTRSVSSAPSPSPSNLYLAPGAQSPDQLIADIAQGFYVTDLIGMGINLVTGDYSRGAAGFWIENGQRTFAVSEVTIAGHLSEVFA